MFSTIMENRRAHCCLTILNGLVNAPRGFLTLGGLFYCKHLTCQYTTKDPLVVYEQKTLIFLFPEKEEFKSKAAESRASLQLLEYRGYFVWRGWLRYG